MWTDVVNPTRNLQLEDCLYQCTANFENRNSERPWPRGPCPNNLPEPPGNCTHHGFLFKRKEINVRQEIYVPMSILFSPRRIGSLTIELNNRRFLVDFGHYGWLVSRSLMGPKSGRAPRSVGQRSWHSLLDAPGNKFKGLLAYPIYPQWKTCLRHWKMESVLGSICSTWNLLFFSGLQHVGSAVRVFRPLVGWGGSLHKPWP